MNYITNTLKFMQCNKLNSSSGYVYNTKLYNKLFNELKLYGYVYIYNIRLLNMFKSEKYVISQYNSYWLVERKET